MTRKLAKPTNKPDILTGDDKNNAINGDGFDDIIVGAQLYNPSVPPNSVQDGGIAYVIYGSAFGKSANPGNLVATPDADKLIGGWGNDVISGIGAGDSARGGAGNDKLEVTGINFVDIDGGNGFDTLKIMGAGDVFDFTVQTMVNGVNTILDARVDSIEAFDLSAAGAQTLKLDRNDVFHLSDTVSGGKTTLVVLGAGGGDTLNLTLDSDAANDNLATGKDAWSKTQGTVIDSHFVNVSFEEYVNGNARVLVEAGIVNVLF